VRPPIGQTLAGETAKGLAATLPIIAAVRDPVVVAELELRDIPMQMLLGAMLIDALHAALEDREAAFNRVGMNAATAIFASAVVDGAVAQKDFAELGLIAGGYGAVNPLVVLRIEPIFVVSTRGDYRG
jgi:hypothetical protein